MTRGAAAEAKRLLEAAGVPYAIIGGHAVNAWLEPRFTADVDVTVAAGPAELSKLKAILEAAQYSVQRELGAELPSSSVGGATVASPLHAAESSKPAPTNPQFIYPTAPRIIPLAITIC